MEIAVIGGGVIGLSTANLLLSEGHSVTLYTKEIPPNVTSSIACAIWLPIWTGEKEEVPLNYADLLTGWSIDSWQEFQHLHQIGAEKYGIHLITNHELFSGEEPLPPYLLATLKSDEIQAVYDYNLPASFNFRWSFKTWLIETPIYLRQLLQDFLERGGKLVLMTFANVAELQQLPEHFIFNCTGLGSQELFGDVSLKGIKGQLLLHEPVALDFALGAGHYYLIPRSDSLILGSTFEESFLTEEPTEVAANEIWQAINQFYQSQGTSLALADISLSANRVKKRVAGLRPYRSKGIRLEVEKIGGKLVIHDYGHGGGGISLSWGCAKNALRLFKDTNHLLDQH
jgi:D-amino-acid oxidase